MRPFNKIILTRVLPIPQPNDLHKQCSIIVAPIKPASHRPLNRPFSVKNKQKRSISPKKTKRISSKFSNNTKNKKKISVSNGPIYIPTSEKQLLSYQFQAYSFFVSNIKKISSGQIQNVNLPKIKASAFFVSTSDLQPLLARNGQMRRQIASLTKIFTLLTTLLLCLKNCIPLSSPVRISHRASSMIGTTAGLSSGDVLSLIDLLYGLMLPSGNDAAVAIAQFIGRTIYRQLNSKQNDSSKIPPRRAYQKYFLQEVNRLNKQMGLNNTQITNPHGLMSSSNYSSAKDLTVISAISTRITLIRKIVSSQAYNAKVYNQGSGLYRYLNWQNTNKLLGVRPYYGIKTGITPSAGPCFSALYKQNQQQIIVVLLKTDTLNLRFVQAQILVKEAMDKESDQASKKIQTFQFNKI